MKHGGVAVSSIKEEKWRGKKAKKEEKRGRRKVCCSRVLPKREKEKRRMAKGVDERAGEKENKRRKDIILYWSTLPLALLFFWLIGTLCRQFVVHTCDEL